MKLLRQFAITWAVLLALFAIAGAQTWTPLNNQPGVNLGAMLQLRDGRILVHEEQSGNARNWHILTPDATGSYVNGTWSSGGQLPSGYAPFFFGSQVLLDGKTIVVEGGEYNSGSQDWTTLGAVGTISGSSITWVNNNPPSGWSRLGDAESVVLANGTYMQSNCCSNQVALFNGPNSWTATGGVLQSNNDESGYTLLTNDLVLTVDTKTDTTCSSSAQGAELYNQGTGVWSCAASLPSKLYNPSDEELGAAVLMYNNKVLQIGGNVIGTNIYDVASNTWAVGPNPLQSMNQADGPAALEPNGLVLGMFSPGLFQGGCAFQEYSPVTNQFTATANPTNCPADSSFVGHLMILPTGQIMFTDFSGLVEIYTPAAGVVSGVAPTITAPTSPIASPSTNNLLSGTQLNGLSGNNAYGDDYQGETNYPLVRLTQISAPNNVYYATTHSETTHSIAPGTAVTTQFDVPSGLANGNYNLVVIANGIASNAVQISIQPVPDFSLSASPGSVTVAQGGQNSSTITITPSNGFSGSVTLGASGLPTGVTAGFSPNPATTTSTVTFTAAGNATVGTSTVTITGTSGSLSHNTTVSLTVSAAGGVTISPLSLTWGNEVIEQAAPTKNVTVTNTGTVTLTFGTISATGDFGIGTSTKPCVTLAAGKNCQIKVTFTPTQLGARTGTLTINDNATSSPQTVPLAGTGVPQATLTPATKSFGSQTVGTTGAAKVFTLSNKRSTSITGISSSTTGDFLISGTTCGSTLASHASCTISVEFKPTAKGTRTGQLQVSDSAFGSPQTSSLSGTGK